MRFLIIAGLALALFTGTALAAEGFDNWGTPYYDQVMGSGSVGSGGMYTAGCGSCGQAAGSGCSHCSAMAAASGGGQGCGNCGQRHAISQSGCAKCASQSKANGACGSCGRQSNKCGSYGAGMRSGCGGGSCGADDDDGFNSAWAWMFE